MSNAPQLELLADARGAGVQASSSASHRRLPQLDGMRAVAVLLVFGAHTVTRGFGWQGVHLFFVLSGFLITGILRRSKDSEAYWRNFYLKRASRIIPALLLFFVWGVLLYSPSWKVLPAYILFGANFAAASRFDFRNAFDVLWSLSVEEHFYLLWPFAIRLLNRAQLIRLCLGICVAEPILRIAFTRVAPDSRTIYMLTPFQLDGLAAGSLLAILFEQQRAREQVGQWTTHVLWFFLFCYASLALASHSFTFAANSFLFNGIGYSLIALISACLLAELYLHPENTLSRLFKVKPLFFLGTISYGFYLFHPLTVDTLERVLPSRYTTGRASFLLAALAFGAATLISWLSFRFYESDVTAWGRRKAEAIENGQPVGD